MACSNVIWCGSDWFVMYGVVWCVLVCGSKWFGVWWFCALVCVMVLCVVFCGVWWCLECDVVSCGELVCYVVVCGGFWCWMCGACLIWCLV